MTPTLRPWLLRTALAIGAVILLAACGGSRPASDAVEATPNAPVAASSTLGTGAAVATTTPLPPTVAPPTAAPTPTPPQPSTGPARVLSRGPASRRVVALTFDAGADRGFAQAILDTLVAERVTASFGITGQWAERNADLLARMARDGHLIINHTYDHSSFTGNSAGRVLSPAERWAELDRAEALIRAATGRSTQPFFRPPYGDYDASVNRDAGAKGYAYNVMWTVDSRGWLGLPAAEITARCVQLAEPGAIYVLHVGAASADAQALPSIIGQLRALGYGFVAVSDFVAE